MSYDLRNKVVFITGAANGIGEKVVLFVLAEHVKHVTLTDVDESKGEVLERDLASKYGADRVKFIKCDCTHDEDVFAAIQWSLDNVGYIDIVINNAGIMDDRLHLYKKEIDLNVTSVVTSTLKAIELMRKDKEGRGGTVINISSVAGITQASYMPIYYGTKSAVLQFSNCMGHEENFDRTGVRVLTIICFGATKTNLVEKIHAFDKQIDDEILDDTLKRYPHQSVESAAKGLIEAYKRGDSGSTWLVNAEKPAQDITPVVRKAFAMLEDLVYNP